MPGQEIPEANELQEIDTMLAERVEEWTNKWKQDGKLEGMQQGMEQGIQQGEASVLQRLLTRRFGPLSPEIQARMKAATLEQLEQWADNILDAVTLEDVFKHH